MVSELTSYFLRYFDISFIRELQEAYDYARQHDVILGMNITSTSPGDKYTQMTGTCVAATFVTGIILYCLGKIIFY